MAVEELVNGHINKIDDLQPVEVRPEGKAMRLYRQVQKTQLWDSDLELWRRQINKDQMIQDPDFYSGDQLIGILVEGMFDNKNTLERYEQLRRTDLYDGEKDQWLQWLEEDLTIPHELRFSGDQLLSILIMGMFSQKGALVQYEQLKQTELYDDVRKQWRECLYNSPLIPSARTARDQLLGVLVEGMFDREEAQILYANLKETELYDKDNGQWHARMGADQKVGNTVSGAGDQLLGIWVEKMLEREEIAPKETAVPVARRF